MAQTVYVGHLDRFGYDLTCVGFTKTSVKKAMREEYIDAYKKWNDGEDPSKTRCDRYGRSNRTYLQEAMEDLEISEYEVGKVEWE